MKDGFGHIMVIFLDKYGELISFLFFIPYHKNRIWKDLLYFLRNEVCLTPSSQMAVYSGCRNLLWIKLKFLSLDDRDSSFVTQTALVIGSVKENKHKREQVVLTNSSLAQTHCLKNITKEHGCFECFSIHKSTSGDKNIWVKAQTAFLSLIQTQSL